MKITVFGLTISSSWGNGHATPYRAIFRALHGMGHEVHFFEKDMPYYRSRRDFETCDYCALTLYEEWGEVRELALHTANDSDAVIAASYLPEGARICDELLALVRPVRVFYDLDTPITLSNLKNGGVEYLDASQIPEFDLFLSFTGGKALEELETTYGARMARPLYGCVDPDLYAKVEPRGELVCDLSYMGTFAPDRQSKVDELFLELARRHPEKKFVLAGALYPGDWQWPENIVKLDHIAPDAHPQFYSSSRITLNITREAMRRNGWCPSGRFFEAAACGTPVITDWWEGLDEFFDLHRDLRVVATADDMEKVLMLPDRELEALAEHARERTLEQHSGKMRAAQLLHYFEEAWSVSYSKASCGERAS